MADIQILIERTVTGLGYELVDFETSPRARLLRVFIDRLPATSDTDLAASKSAITADDCATVSHQLTRLFTVENIDYDRLEVSSPGMDRPLKKAADYLRFIGHQVQLKLRIPEGTQRNFSGEIVTLDAGCLHLMVDGAEREFALDNIEKARLVPKF
jgi:ribosome maturation factor RimP